MPKLRIELDAPLLDELVSFITVGHRVIDAAERFIAESKSGLSEGTWNSN